LTNFVPLSLYVTIEIIVVALKLFINYDLDMYHEGTDTRALARSSNVTDLGQVEYVFSDKTGTLTQNVMRFKRCSVDGLAFGAPVEKARPGAEKGDEEDVSSSFHPLRQLLVGQVAFSSDRATSHWNTRRPSDGLKARKPSTGLAALGEEDLNVDDEKLDCNGNLSFNAEMFLRVMSLCHTVVVEKDLDNMEILQASASSVEESSSGNRLRLDSLTRGLFGGRKNTGTSAASSGGDLEAIAEMEEGRSNNGERQGAYSSASKTSQTNGNSPGVGPDGAPAGFAYQAESPDEGALVQAASLTFGFQVVGRDASGIRLACSSPSLFQDATITEGLKKGKLTSQQLASETAARRTPSAASDMDGGPPIGSDEARVETWTVLAVNKFDSDRKRMSILLRSPPELGSIPMLLCKGADSSMLDPKVCVGLDSLMSGEEDVDEILMRNMELDVPRKHESIVSQLTTASDYENRPTRATDDEPNENFETTALLGIQSHLGDFASEGLRTLVLGVRILTEEECDQWMATYTAASTSIKDREEKLKKAAFEIEQNIHIVGATAIEDKLQRGVPETIAKLEKAGIKLWVLTGDKRETAIEIGYSTHVLTPKMHVTEVADGPSDRVRALMAMEFMRLVKMGKLTDYQRSVVGSEERKAGSFFEDFRFRYGKRRRAASRAIRRFYHKYIKPIFCFFCYVRYGDDEKNPALVQIETEVMREESILKERERKKNVRDRAEQIIKEYNVMTRKLPKKGAATGDDDELSLTDDKRPQVFTRSKAAKTAIEHRRSQGSMTSTELRSLELAEMTAKEATEGPLIEEDLLSLQSFLPGDSSEGNFDARKRTLLERVFAVDRSVRHGTLVKHLRKEKLEAIREDEELGHKFSERGLDEDEEKAQSLDTPRALVIEGAALAHLLGDSELEELLFAVASCSDSVIACRVSPKQKALLVGLVRNYVSPEPVTLAIGDGANDVGMIQEAHVGVGISGLEGQQAVNASDFAIAQFRYLEELLLVHGRWNFFRQTTVVLFSFYKNAVMAGNLIVFQGECLYSGQPLFDDWLIAMLNFVAGCPILFLGFFDRCLEKDYVKSHPEVYGPARRNELLTLRILFRWIILAFVHIFTLFYFTVWPLKGAGGITAAFTGMMRNKRGDALGDGQGGDLKSVGTVTFTCLVVMLGLKVFYESKTILVGKFPVITCRKGVGEGWPNRMRYTLVGTLWLSYGFYLFAIYVYAVGFAHVPAFVLTFVLFTI
jgi:magnesium-transporting ATPase (P-type)